MARVPAVTADEMGEIDRRMAEDYHIALEMMMENAGRALAMHARRLLGSRLRQEVLVLAGKGNNGGGGLVAARHLHNWGADVQVALSSAGEGLKETPARQLDILRSMGMKITRRIDRLDLSASDLIIDALLGYRQRGDPRGETAQLATAANESGRPILSLDVPTGLDPDTGCPNEPCVRASQTLTLALPKRGLYARRAKPYVGALFLADISVPSELYREFGVRAPIFASGPIIELTAYGRDERLEARARRDQAPLR